MAEPAREQLVDPVCGMRMDPEEAPAVATYGGRSYYFCSDTHKEEFLKDPETYVKLVASEEGEK
ncbi:MAG TPA: YHS domain-containing protein [Armatimonadota bacterium]|jgi:YHS domain-containing protein|nr:YHS domain-containing protein [Armatimonadota bacterium]